MKCKNDSGELSRETAINDLTQEVLRHYVLAFQRSRIDDSVVLDLRMVFGLLLLFFLQLIDFSELLHGLFAVFAEGNLNLKRVLIFVCYFQQGMERVFGFFTVRAQVVVLADETFVDDSFDREGKASIALNILVQYLIGLLFLYFIFTNETGLFSFDFCFRLIFKLEMRIYFFLPLKRHIPDTSIHDLNLRDLAGNLLHLHISETFFDDKREIVELCLSYGQQHFLSQPYYFFLFQVNIKLQGQPLKAPTDNLPQILQTSNFPHIDIPLLSPILHFQSLMVHAITNNS